jgi:transposase
MDALSLPPDAPLPDDVTTLQQMVRELLAEVARLRAENAELSRRLDEALKHRFGRRSERQKPKPAPPGAGKPQRKRDEHGRAPLPEHLERRTVAYDLTEAEKLCPCCGKPRVCIGAPATEQLDMEPARFFVRRTVRKTYACVDCVGQEGRFQAAGPAEVGPIGKGLSGAGLLAAVITAKFADHTPLHRFAAQAGRSGVQIPCSTLGGWVAQAADLLKPLYQLMHQRLLLSRVIHSDDTTVKLRVEGANRAAKAHLWAYIGEADYPYVLFDFTADYTAQGPRQFLEGYQGYLQADALAQYECLYSPAKVKHACCWAHARRKFVAAAEAGDERAGEALERIGKLYASERELPALLLPSDDPAGQEQRRRREEQRREIRRLRAGPVLAELKKWKAGKRRRCCTRW